MKTTIFMLLFCLTASAQDAHVVQLRPTDADEARQTWDQLQIAKQNWEAVKKSMAEKYLKVNPSSPDASDQHWPQIPTSASLLFSSPSSGDIFTAGSCVALDGSQNPIAIDCKTGKPIHAETEQEKAARVKRERDEHEKWLANYNLEPRVRKGFDSSPGEIPRFEFSHDFKFMVPPKPEPPAQKDCTLPFLTN